MKDAKENFEEKLLKSAEQAVEIARVLRENSELKERINMIKDIIEMGNPCSEVIEDRLDICEIPGSGREILGGKEK